MKGKTYDLNKLSATGNFDIGVTSRFYYNTQDYFDALSDFYLNFKRDLTNYTPAFVINSEDDRKEFLQECFEIRAEFVRLGITALLEALSVMEDAAITRKFSDFSDGQVTFRATLKICKEAIKDAEMPWKISAPRKSSKK